ncbi:MAG: SIMPL domain-containing protein [Methanotrichaceae archaeon]|nr:SIMPL domain-containing protein [Methanotrichaceae archaeon]
MKSAQIVLLSLAVLIASTLPAGAAGDENASKIIVNGEGKVIVVPDMAVVVLGVETRNASAEKAARENAELMNETISALLTAGIAEKDIQTSQFSLTTNRDQSPYSTSEGKEPLPLEFIATNRVSVRLNDTQGIGMVLDAAVSAGSNSIQSINFDLQDSQPQEDLALSRAVDDAQRKAQIVADAAGVQLGRILEISEGYGYTSSRNEVAFAYAAAPTTPISPGELEITASVTATYEIS